MSLQKRCLSEVLPGDRERGVRYFHQRRVSLGARETEGIAATVEGPEGSVYEVQIDWTRAEYEGLLIISCSCPRFAEFTVCKHVWATMVAYDSAQFTELVPGQGPLELSLTPPSYDEGAGATANDSWPPSRSLTESSRDRDQGDTSDLLDVYRKLKPTLRRHTPQPTWLRQLGSIRQALGAASVHANPWPQVREVRYCLNIADCLGREQLIVDLYQRKSKKSGELGRFGRLFLGREPTESFPDADDRELLKSFQNYSNNDTDPYRGRFYAHHDSSQGTVPVALYEHLLPRLCATGRFGWVRDGTQDPAQASALSWDNAGPWRFGISLEPDAEDDGLRVVGILRRGEETRPLSEPVLLLASGIVVWRDRISRLAAEDTFPWISMLRREDEIRVPENHREALFETLGEMPLLPELKIPAEWQWDIISPTPRSRLTLWPSGASQLRGDVTFEYDTFPVPARWMGERILDRDNRRVIQRQETAEQTAFAQLHELGMQPSLGKSTQRYDVKVSQKVFGEAIETLLTEGWLVEADGSRIRAAGNVSFSVTSNIDWFELSGDIDFDGTTVPLPQLLAAVRGEERMIQLGDGTQGMLPQEWLDRFAPLAKLSHGQDGEAVRYLPSQAVLLDTLLATEPQVDVDHSFFRLRERLEAFDRIAPIHESPEFRGELRAYQREGLGWLKFLEDFDFGGCLADDMGLGKTVQVLAALQTRSQNTPSGDRRPSLIVVPRSVVYNWQDEAARFTPQLRMAIYSGPQRKRLLETLDDHDLVVTTYGVLRRDILRLKSINFDYVILDEAQAIKNPSSQAAKASRLVRARHRLALTGTPVENHLGELWSLFEFLNPGLLGRLPAFKGLAGNRTLGDTTLAAVARALRPFILRRTKEAVLDDLPAKTEQTLFCELGASQRRLYKELRNHYRAALDRRIEEQGLKRSKIQVLEALLRLRQAACHPALIDPTRSDQDSAKLEVLIEQLNEVLSGGHKALVFSQFTSLLALVKRRLNALGITYEYLDGKTRDRKTCVDRFQTDPDCPVFLISLKAGGLGLNLTAADYVFILDPWWNPAVEAQAVDRAHRIGQNRPVFAYRLIASDTVEEKILELQQSKRELADAILNASGSMIRDLSAEDLQLLLS